MSGSRRPVLRAFRGGDDGVALVTVIGTMALLALFVAGTTILATGTQRLARHDQDWNAALAAANAGLDEYLANLNSDDRYWTYGDASSPFTATSTVVAPPAGSPFVQWTDLPGSDGAQFRYDVDTSRYQTAGEIRVQASGRVGDDVRTVRATLARRGFIDYVYFTNIEQDDPSRFGPNNNRQPQQGFWPTAELAAVHCSNREWEWADATTPGRTSQRRTELQPVVSRPHCHHNRWSGDALLDGPFHTNDTILVCDHPTFTGAATTSYDGSRTDGRRYVRITDSGCAADSAPNAPHQGDNFFYAAPLTMPPSNDEMELALVPTVTGGPAGCLYVGPTEIVLNGDRMTVTSPWTSAGATGPLFCGVGTNIPVPQSPGRVPLIFVQDVPAVPDEYTAQGAAAPVCAANSNPVGYPRTYGGDRDVTAYDCRAGDLFVRGTLDGQLTMGAESNIVIIGDLTYAQAGCTSDPACDDVLGLVANEYIQLHHPVGRCTSSYFNGCRSLEGPLNQDNGSRTNMMNPTIEAAMLAVGHVIEIQNERFGEDRGTLTVRGSMAQRFRGGMGGSRDTSVARGYDKVYEYDSRLRYLSPPHFLDPSVTNFGVRSWAEVQPATYP